MHEGRHGVLNEGEPSPYQQVKDNGQAVQAFLEEYEDRFADETSKGSLWHKLHKTILFTEPGVRFATKAPSCWRATAVAVLDSGTQPDRDVVKYLADLTTPERDHHHDKRSQIQLTPESIAAIIELLNGEPFDFQVDTGEQDVLFAEYGVEEEAVRNVQSIAEREILGNPKYFQKEWKRTGIDLSDIP